MSTSGSPIYTDLGTVINIPDDNGATSDLSTVDPNPAIAQPGNTDQNGIDVAMNTFATLGVTIASAVTGRPVINNNGVPTLGQPPVVTGQVQANTVLLVLAAVAIAAIFIFATKRG